MAITRLARRAPVATQWRDFDEMSDRLFRLFNDVGSGVSSFTSEGWAPPVNVEETENEVVLTAELPGMTHEDVEVHLENNVLTIRGEKSVVRQEENGGHRIHLFERRYGSFTRSFTLPRTVKADDINASFENGILTVTMPKVAEAKGRRIEIAPPRKR